MINFTVGPVQMFDKTLGIGSEQIPYFRTEEFSRIMFENEEFFLKLLNAPKDSKAVFVTGSGTASMEAVVMNCLDKKDKCIVVNGGSFGERFSHMLQIHGIKHDEIRVAFGSELSKDDLTPFENKGYTAFLINMHETSVGTLYNLKVVSEFCNQNKCKLIVDAISSFLTDEIDMEKDNIDVLISGSQKALACAPGVSMIAISPTMLQRMKEVESGCMYLNLRDALRDAERGQTPFTPAVGTLLQIHERFKGILDNGGVKTEILRTKGIADDFRARISKLPFEITSKSLSNAMTPLHPTSVSAYELFEILKNKYGIWVCPNGGELRDYIFRVGHMGNLSVEDNITLVKALGDLTVGKER